MYNTAPCPSSALARFFLARGISGLNIEVIDDNCRNPSPVPTEPPKTSRRKCSPPRTARVQQNRIPRSLSLPRVEPSRWESMEKSASLRRVSSDLTLYASAPQMPKRSRSPDHCQSRMPKKPERKLSNSGIPLPTDLPEHSQPIFILAQSA
jgi:Leucine-rich repeat (LRR) protein